MKIKLLCEKVPIIFEITHKFFLKHLFLIIGIIYFLKIFLWSYISVTGCIALSMLFVLLGLRIPQNYLKKNVSAGMVLFGLFAILNISSALWGIFYGHGFRVFLIGVLQIYIPMLMFYMGYLFDKVDKYAFYWLKCIFIIIAIGVILYFWNPGFYLNYCDKIFNAYNNTSDLSLINYGGRTPRMYGILMNSQTMSGLSLAGLCFTFKMKKEFKNKWVLMVYVGIFVIGIIFAKQRSIWVGTLLIVCFLISSHITDRRVVASINIVLLGIVCVIVVMGSLLFNILMQSSFGERLSSFSGILTERARNERNVLAMSEFLKHPVFGEGFSHHGALDGNWFRILSDTGIAGMMLFLAIALPALWFCLKTKENNILAGLILAYFIASIGSATLDGMITGGLIFWPLVGYLWKKREQYNEKICRGESVS